jgi:GDP-mannose transporter
MEKDAAEVKKALATGALKETHASPGEHFWMTRSYKSHNSRSAVPPILCYCLASILMTMVNKVRTPSITAPFRPHLRNSSLYRG